jgi:hypothetical protein
MPIVINAILFFLWVSWIGEFLIPLFSLAFNALAAPIYLGICNAQFKDLHFIKKTVYSFVSISISILIDYCGWGISTERLFSPDTMTVFILWGKFVCACVIISTGLIYAFFTHLKNKNIR